MGSPSRAASIPGAAQDDVPRQHSAALPFAALLTEAARGRLVQHARLRPLLAHLGRVGPRGAPTLAQAAQRTCASRITLNRWFKDAVGHPYGLTIALWRLAEARMRLASPRAAEKNVAPVIGYASASTLARAFARRTGTTPRGRTSRAQARARLTCPGSLRCLRPSRPRCSFQHESSVPFGTFLASHGPSTRATLCPSLRSRAHGQKPRSPVG